MKKLLSILITAAIACTLTACGNGGEGQVSEETVAVAEMKTIEPPEDGWTLEQLNQVLYMNGQKIELPLMFSSLGDGYEIRDKRYNDESSKDSDIVGGALYYKDQFVAVTGFHEYEDDYEFLTMIFSPTYCTGKQNPSEYIRINGFGMTDDSNKLKDCLGNNYIFDSNVYAYDIKNSNYSIDVFGTENNYDIMIQYTNSKE